MLQTPTPEGEHLKPSQFYPKPYHYVITSGYKPYREACKCASEVVFGMMNKEKREGTYDPATFVTDVWQKSAAYQKTDRLWEVYKREARIKLGKIARKNVGDILESAS